ncbi:hypothetical protein RchiOBHm_Chr6g0286881 [Rosa chinensis]|uniref:Uncharacterized protein n=1 Tax=Rosa chinensis TaxID=74649 RepID=A0A2P6PUY1_ROSCH|nr:uncharacterized protein LOC112174084 [Rosa chinensis]PRQ25733.1 hypothetical protein RchiOBHm_Chr6g0286881 [Rosa chinensis]
MSWSHPDISLEEFMKLVKGFVDILILLSGYQSSGHLAHWDSQNIKKAFQWGLFFENFLGSFSSSDDYVDSVMELDGAISEMTSAASFPKGLAHMSTATLATARRFVLEHLIHSLPLRDAHLRALLTATVEMDLEELSEIEHDFLNVYLSKLKLQDTLMQQGIEPARKFGDCGGNGLTKYAVQELLKRWSVVSLISAVESGLDVLSQSVRHSSWSEFDDNLLKEQLEHENTPVTVDWLVGSLTWNRWKSNSLSYFLDKRTVQLVSGASMVFSTPKIQWVQTFQQLNFSDLAGGSDNGLCETIELMLLGCIASRWTSVIEHLVSVSYDSHTVLEQYHEVCNLLHGRSTTLRSKQEAISQATDVLEYLSGMLDGQVHLLWKICPALGAVAIPSWSPLFRLYLSEIQIQVRGDLSTMRCCDCAHNRKEHTDCELAQRIWCLYVFHVYGSRLIAHS